jgi:isoleucyl-tRNA synthetase
LVGIKYEQLLDYAKPYQNPENAFRVISGDFVTTEDGTGIVHTAPTFGADDAKVAKKLRRKFRQCWFWMKMEIRFLW